MAVGIEFEAFKDGYSLIAQALHQAGPGQGVKIHMELIESMLDRWLAGKKTGTLDRVQRRLMRVEFVKLLADQLEAQYIPTDDGNLDPDPDLYVEPSGLIFARMPPGQRLLSHGDKRHLAVQRSRFWRGGR
jgi:hypothetical protein